MKICRECHCSEARACVTTAGRGCAWSASDPTLCTCCTGEEQRLTNSVASSKFEKPQPDPIDLAAAGILEAAAEEDSDLGEAFVDVALRGVDALRNRLVQRGFDLPAVAVVVVHGQGELQTGDGERVEGVRLNVGVAGEPADQSKLTEMIRTGMNHARDVENSALGFSTQEARDLFEKEGPSSDAVRKGAQG